MNTADQHQAHIFLERIIEENGRLTKENERLEIALKLMSGEDKDILLKAVERIQDNKAQTSFGALSATHNARWAQQEMNRAHQGMSMQDIQAKLNKLGEY